MIHGKPTAHQMPEGESMESFQQRQINAILDIISKEDSENICIVSHGTAIQSYYAGLKECR